MSNSTRRQLTFALSLILGLGVMEPALNPPTANAACFFWQACARSRGSASNTRAGGKRTGRIRGGNNAEIPYVISPRNAWIRQPEVDEANYTIRWNPVEGTASYTVQLWLWTYEQDEPNVALWEDTVDGTVTEVEFPNLVLTPGAYYSIEVTTDSGVSSDLDEGFYKSGFQLLFSEDYEILKLQLSDIAADIPDDTDNVLAAADGLGDLTEESALAKAGVFFLEEMYADALIVLQELIASNKASDLVYTALGDTYSRTGLNQLSIASYREALKLAQSNSDLLSEATIRVNLADVYATLGEFDDALGQLSLARLAYIELAEEAEVERLNRRISLLSQLVAQQNESADQDL
ncbi:MAG: tetratricopeptide repeat protein [Cyanobacteria bacterium P01_D01_bin.156]